MKTTISKIIIGVSLSILLLLTGCSMSKVTTNDSIVSRDIEISRSECYKSRTLDLSTIPKEQVALVAQSKLFADAMLTVSGKDPCASMNVYEAKVAEVVSKNNTVTAGVGSAASVAKYGIVGVSAVELIKNVGATSYSASDEASIDVTNENMSRNTTGITDESYNSKAGDDTEGSVTAGGTPVVDASNDNNRSEETVDGI